MEAIVIVLGTAALTMTIAMGSCFLGVITLAYLASLRSRSKRSKK